MNYFFINFKYNIILHLMAQSKPSNNLGKLLYYHLSIKIKVENSTE